MRKNSAPKIPTSLLQKLKDNKVILFVGAGLSINSGAFSWPTLLAKLIEKCDQEGIDISRDKKELNTLLKGGTPDLLIAAKYLRSVLKEKMDEALKETLTKLRPNEAHSICAKIGFPGIITTNYDSLIEDKIREYTGVPCSVILPARLYDLARIEDNELWVLKLHGSVEDPGTIVLTFDDYEELYKEKSTHETFYRLMQRYTLLFVGFGMEDPDTVQQLVRMNRIFGSSRQRHYALVETSNFGKIKEDFFLDAYGIQLIKYRKTSNKHPEVLDFLRNLQEYVEKTRLAKMCKGLIVIKSLRSLGFSCEEPMLLVTNANPQWVVKAPSPKGGEIEERAYLLPSISLDFATVNGQKIADLLSTKKAISQLFSIEEHQFDIKVDPVPFLSTKFNPSTGRVTEYELHFIEIALHQSCTAFYETNVRLGSSKFEWLRLQWLRGHNATKELNKDVLIELSQRYGANLEKLPLSIEKQVYHYCDFYDDRAVNSYKDLPWVKDEQIFKALFSEEDLQNAKGVLDLGCGPGVLGSYLAKKSNLKYIGLDVSSKMVSLATALLENAPHASVYKKDIMLDSFSDHCNGWIFVMKNVLHLLPSVEQFLVSLSNRFGIPQKLVIVETVSPDPIALSWVKNLFENMCLEYKYNWYIKGQLPFLLQTWGFKVVDTRYVAQFIDVPKWVNSFSIDDDRRLKVNDLFTNMPPVIKSSMEYNITPEGSDNMLRLQEVITVQVTSNSHQGV